MAIALKAISYDGNSLRSYPRIYGWVEEGLFDGMEIRGRDDVLLGTDGEFVRNRKLSQRRITVMINLQGAGTTPSARAIDFISLKSNIESWFSLKSTRNLQVTLENDAVYTIAARVIDVDPGDLFPYYAQMTIVLESKAPNWTVT